MVQIDRVLNRQIRSGEYVSSEIGNAIAFYLVAPDLAFPEGIQVDFYLQLPTNVLEDRLVLLQKQEIDTLILGHIPFELSLIPNKYIVIVCDFENALQAEIWTIKPDTNYEEIENKLDDILLNQTVDRAFDIALTINQLSQNAAILSLGAGVGAALTPFTGGASLAIPGAITTNLAPGVTALTPLLLAP